MDLEGTDSLLNQMDMAGYDGAFAGSQNVGIGGKHILVDELKNTFKGNEGLVYGRTSEPLTILVDLYQNIIGDIDQLDNHANYVDFKLIFQHIWFIFRYCSEC